MEIRNLGTSGLRVSAIGLGCNNFAGRIDLEATRRVIHKAHDLGITLFERGPHGVSVTRYRTKVCLWAPSNAMPLARATRARPR